MSVSAQSVMIGTALATLALDRVSKWLVVEAMDLRNLLAIDVVPGLFSLRMAWNRGVNFGMFAGDSADWPLILAGLSVVVSIAVAVWVWRRGGVSRGLAAGVLIGGALGNAWDRLTYGAVADFLNVTCCGLYNPWAFNVADIGVFAGAFTLAALPSRS